jgi:hypothetical protein
LFNRHVSLCGDLSEHQVEEVTLGGVGAVGGTVAGEGTDGNHEASAHGRGWARRRRDDSLSRHRTQGRGAASNDLSRLDLDFVSSRLSAVQAIVLAT